MDCEVRADTLALSGVPGEGFAAAALAVIGADELKVALIGDLTRTAKGSLSSSLLEEADAKSAASTFIWWN
jgi:hypothetical protein